MNKTITTSSYRLAVALTCVALAGCTGSTTGEDGTSDGTGAMVGAGSSLIGAGGGTGAGGMGVGVGGMNVGAGGSTAPDPQVHSRTGLAARLSKVEYQYSILDVLEVDLLPEELDAAAGGIPDDNGDGVFKHLADNQTSVEQHALAYFQVAEAVANRVDMPGLIAKWGTCAEASEACGSAIIHALGSRLYRRPLDEREVDAMLAVYNLALEEQLDHVDATRWTLMAMLSAPQFLFQMQDEVTGDPGAVRDLSSYELAARLASFLWVSVPDDELLAAAADQSLLDPAQLDAQVQRMLADPKAQRFTELFAVDFSRARFSSYEGSTDADRAALNESVVATFQDHFWTQQGSIADLFLTTRFIINPTVAALLGVTTTGSGLEAVDVAELPERVGLMSHPGVIAGMGDLVVGSFVNRGKYLLERLLCRNPTAFPSTISSEIEEFNATTAGLNEHERAELRMSRPTCWNCHQQFEPLAFGFSRFDGAGRYLGDSDAEQKPLSLEGWVPTGEQDEPQYSDVESYMQILATNPVIQTCMTEHFLDFATSRIGDRAGESQAEQVGLLYQASGSTLSAMVSAVVQSQLFRTVITSSQGTQP